MSKAITALAWEVLSGKSSFGLVEFKQHFRSQFEAEEDFEKLYHACAWMACSNPFFPRQESTERPFFLTTEEWLQRLAEIEIGFMPYVYLLATLILKEFKGDHIHALAVLLSREKIVYDHDNKRILPLN